MHLNKHWVLKMVMGAVVVVIGKRLAPIATKDAAA